MKLVELDEHTSRTKAHRNEGLEVTVPFSRTVDGNRRCFYGLAAALHHRKFRSAVSFPQVPLMRPSSSQHSLTHKPRFVLGPCETKRVQLPFLPAPDSKAGPIIQHAQRERERARVSERAVSLTPLAVVDSVSVNRTEAMSFSSAAVNVAAGCCHHRRSRALLLPLNPAN